MATKRTIIPLITSEDISRYPDQSSYKINQVINKVNSLWKEVYPVGSYYETSDAGFAPEESWGGKWEQVSTGRWHRVA